MKRIYLSLVMVAVMLLGVFSEFARDGYNW